MAKLKLTVSKEALEQGAVEQPQPGVYTCRVLEMNSGFSKNDDGTEDKNRPRVEVVFRTEDKRSKGARLWDYITFSEASEWKIGQYINAFNVSSKTKGKNVEAELDTAKIAAKVTDIVKGKKVVKETKHPGQLCRIQVVGDTDRDGNYRARVRNVMPFQESADPEEESDDFDEGETDEEEVETEDVEEETEDEEDEELGEDEDEELEDEEESNSYSEDELKEMSVDEMKEVARNLNIEFKGKKKKEVISLILAAQEGGDDDEDDEELPF